jgi:hypothetical protein
VSHRFVSHPGQLNNHKKLKHKKKVKTYGKLQKKIVKKEYKGIDFYFTGDKQFLLCRSRCHLWYKYTPKWQQPRRLSEQFFWSDTNMKIENKF